MLRTEKTHLTHPYLLRRTHVLSAMDINTSLCDLGDHTNGGTVFTNDGPHHLIGYKNPTVTKRNKRVNIALLLLTTLYNLVCNVVSF